VIYGSFSRSEAREDANPNLSAFSTETAKFPLAADKGSGGLWNNRPGSPGKDPLVKADKPFGQWNHFRIIMAGSRVWVWLRAHRHRACMKPGSIARFHDALRINHVSPRNFGSYLRA
jgi:hypothetical protein